MTRTTLTRLCTHTLGVTIGTALILGAASLPAVAAAAPTDVSGVTGTVGDHVLSLAYTNSNPKSVVRDVTGVSGTITPTSGRSVSAATTTASDPGFTNTATATYAVWGADASGNTSPDAEMVSVAPVDPLATTLVLRLSRTQAVYGQKYAVGGTLDRNGSPSANQVVQVLTRVRGTQTVNVSRQVKTDAKGEIDVVLATSRTVDVSLRYAGDAFSKASGSEHQLMNLLPVLTSSFSPADVTKGEKTNLIGHVTSGLDGATLQIEQNTTKGWVATKQIHPNSKGNYTWPYTANTAGAFTYRARILAGTDYLGAASPARGLEVDLRDLVEGDTGSDVLALERKLAALHYSPGKVDDTFDQNTEHAVIAYEKVERLPRNGTWTKVERTRLAHAHAWTLRYGGSGRHIEVDFTRQVVVYSENGVVKYIMDTSTGGEYHYTYQGVTYLAHTPRGHFKIQRKIDGVRHSNLGYLYRPSYFTGGYAVHGEDYDVPTKPASHGCVRVTNYNADILFPLLTVGTPVDLYDE